MVQIIPRADITAERILELLHKEQVQAELCDTGTGIGVYIATTHFDIVITTGDWLMAKATWVGELDTQDYVRSLVALNAANNSAPVPKFSIDTPPEHSSSLVSVLKADEGPLEVSTSLVYPLGEGVTEIQLRSFLAEAINAGIRITREFHALYPERSPKQQGETFRIGVAEGNREDQVTPQRVEQWFRGQGVDEASYDGATKCISLSWMRCRLILTSRTRRSCRYRPACFFLATRMPRRTLMPLLSCTCVTGRTWIPSFPPFP